MKKLLGIVVLGLLWCNFGVSGENKFTVRNLNINLPNEYELQKIGSMVKQTTNWNSTKWKMNIYAQVREGKLVSLLETFDNEGLVYDTVYSHVKKALFKQGPNSSCSKPNPKKYFQALSAGGFINCVSVKILNHKV